MSPPLLLLGLVAVVNADGPWWGIGKVHPKGPKYLSCTQPVSVCVCVWILESSTTAVSARQDACPCTVQVQADLGHGQEHWHHDLQQLWPGRSKLGGSLGNGTRSRSSAPL